MRMLKQSLICEVPGSQRRRVNRELNVQQTSVCECVCVCVCVCARARAFV